MSTSENGLIFVQVANQMVFFVPLRHWFPFTFNPFCKDIDVTMSIIELVIVSIH